MIQLLSPMFEIDYLLPRSFVAVLNIRKFECTVCEKMIPPDVVLAGINTFLKTDIIFKSDKMKINVIDKIMKKDTRKENMKVETFIAFIKTHINTEHKNHLLPHKLFETLKAIYFWKIILP